MAHINVTVDDQHLSSIGDVADALRANGMEIDQIHRAIGIITGSVSGDRQSSLKALAGVASVDEQLNYQLPPPDADIQ